MENQDELWEFVSKNRKISVYYEEKVDGVGGEGRSSRAHGIPDGTGNDQLHGPWTDLHVKVKSEE